MKRFFALDQDNGSPFSKLAIDARAIRARNTPCLLGGIVTNEPIRSLREFASAQRLILE